MLEGKTLTFEVYEKTPLLEDMNKPLPLIHKSAEKTRIQAKVENGFAVAEVQLRPKSDEDFKEWKEALSPKEVVAITDPIKGQSYPKDSMQHSRYLWGIGSYEPVYGEPLPPLTAKLYLKVSCQGDVKLHKKEFLKDEGLEVGKGSLLFPLKSIPQNYPGNYKTSAYGKYDYTLQKSNAATFGINRGSKRLHAARDLYTDVNEDILAIADGRVLAVENFYMGTSVVVIEHDYEYVKGYKMTVRYGEVNPNTIKVKKDDLVFRGQKIAEIGQLIDNGVNFQQPNGENRGMLHIEFYTGEEKDKTFHPGWVATSEMLHANSFSKNRSFNRRRDLFDGLELLEEMLNNSKNENLIK